MAPAFTLVPSELFSEGTAREALSKVVLLKEGEPLCFENIPPYDAVLVYSGDKRPPVYDMLLSLCKISDYNKMLLSLKDGWLCVTMAQDNRLQLCNCYRAVDETTAVYYILMLLGKFQINPVQITVYFMEGLTGSLQLTLCQYVKSAEELR